MWKPLAKDKQCERHEHLDKTLLEYQNGKLITLNAKDIFRDLHLLWN